MDSESKLFCLRRNIDARIETILLEEGNDKRGFLVEILKTGEIIITLISYIVLSKI